MYEPKKDQRKIFIIQIKVHFADAGYLYIAETCMKRLQEKSPIEEKVKIPHTQQKRRNKLLHIRRRKMEAGRCRSIHGQKVDPAHPGSNLLWK